MPALLYRSVTGCLTKCAPYMHGVANYNVWHIKMRYILIDLGLFKYVESMAPPLTDDKSNESAIKIWNEKNHKALSTISLHVDDSALVYIAGAKTSKEAWDTLKRIYEAAGTISIIATHWKPFRTHCPEGADIEEHICTLCGLRQQLASQGQAMLGSEFSTILLTSLPNSWDLFVSTIDKSTILDTADPDSSKLISKILEENLRKKSKNTFFKIALPAHGNHNYQGPSTTNNYSHRSKYNTNVTCHYCKRVGHIQKECWTKKRDLQNCKGTFRVMLSHYWGSVLLVAHWQYVYTFPSFLSSLCLCHAVRRLLYYY